MFPFSVSLKTNNDPRGPKCSNSNFVAKLLSVMRRKTHNQRDNMDVTADKWQIQSAKFQHLSKPNLLYRIPQTSMIFLGMEEETLGQFPDDEHKRRSQFFLCLKDCLVKTEGQFVLIISEFFQGNNHDKVLSE